MLTPKEEEIMQILWQLKKAFVKDIIGLLPDPKPHYNTISTTIRKLAVKGIVGHEAFGNTHRYFPLLQKEDFLEKKMKNTVEQYYGSSFKNIVTHFAESEKISLEELKEIISLIEKGKEKS